MFKQQRLTGQHYCVLCITTDDITVEPRHAPRFNLLLIGARPLRTAPLLYPYYAVIAAHDEACRHPTVRKKKPGSNNQSCLCRTPYRASHIIYTALSTPTSTSYAYWQIFLKRKPCFRSKTLSVVTSYSHFFVTHVRSETKCRRTTSFNNMLHIPQFIIKGPLPNIALSCPSHNLFYIN